MSNNRKLKRGVKFDNMQDYCKYQILLMVHFINHGHTEFEFVSIGLAEKFELHHKGY